MLLKALRQLSGFSMVPYFARRHCAVVALRAWLIGAEYDWLAKRGSGIEGSERLDELLGWYSCWFGQAGVLAFLSLAIAASVVEIGVWRQSVNLSLVVPEIRKIDETPASLKGENVVRADLNPFIRIITWEFFLGGVAGVDGICWWAVL